MWCVIIVDSWQAYILRWNTHVWPSWENVKPIVYTDIILLSLFKDICFSTFGVSWLIRLGKLYKHKYS